MQDIKLHKNLFIKLTSEMINVQNASHNKIIIIIDKNLEQ